VDVYAWNDNDRPGKPRGGESQGLHAFLAYVSERYW
jgi:leucyl aminopeptidase